MGNTSSLGTNLGLPQDWSSEIMFNDVMKQSRPWMSVQPNGQPFTGSLDLDQDGWVRSLQPGQIASTLMFWSTQDLHHPDGQYTVLFDGTGTLRYNVPVVSRSPGCDIISVSSAVGNPVHEGIQLSIISTEPTNPVRNIRVMMPGTEHFGKTFYQPFLDKLSPFSLIRFMQSQATDERLTVQRSWSQRPKLSDCRWTVQGLPVEVMVELCNILSCDAYFNIHHQQDDEYVRQFMTVVRDTLRSDSKVYLEYSNEIWNGVYPQSTYCRNNGIALGLDVDPFLAQLKFYSQRAVEVFAVCRQVLPFDPLQTVPDRLVCVLGGQCDRPVVARTVLSWRNAYLHANAFAVAPYFGFHTATQHDHDVVSALTLDQAMGLLSSMAVPNAISFASQQKSIADQYHLPLITYEGGQSLVGEGQNQFDTKINLLFDQMNRDPRMRDVYTQYLTGWKNLGGQLFIHYQNCAWYGPFSRFGALENLDQPRSTAPKYDALLMFMESAPRWW